MKGLKPKILFLFASIVILFFAFNPIIDACGAMATSCNAWCETFGNCLGNEMCHSDAISATCTCGPTTKTFKCPFRR